MSQVIDNTRADSLIRYRHYFREVWRFYERPVARVSIALLFTVFAITFFALFAISPTLNTIGELLKKIETQKVSLEQLKKKSAALATVQGEYALAQNSLYLLNEAIPESPDYEELLLQIEGTAADNQLSLSSIAVNSDIVIAEPETSQEAIEIPLTVSLSAAYTELKPFLQDLSRLPRLVVIESISFQEPTTNQAGQNPDDLILSIRLKAYYQPPKKASKASTTNNPESALTP